MVEAAARPGAKFDYTSIEVFGHSVGLSVAGSGDEVLVICPGSAGADGSWAKDMLAERMRVIELNPPGWGGTTPLAHRMDQKELATILAAALAKFGLTSYHLHGASMGGVTAMWLALQYPERVISLSLEGGMNFVSEDNLVSPANARVLAEMVARNDPEGSGYPRAAPHWRKPWSDDAFIRQQMRKRIPMMRMLTNEYEQEARSLIPQLPVPILVMLGDQDELVLPNHLAKWRELAPPAQTLLIPGGAHDIQNTEPAVFVDALLEFMRTSARAGPQMANFSRSLTQG